MYTLIAEATCNGQGNGIPGHPDNNWPPDLVISLRKRGGIDKTISHHRQCTSVSTLYHRIPFSPNRIFSENRKSLFPISHFFPTSDMSDQSPSSHLQVLFEAALQDYENKTGIALAEHPLADSLQNCDSVESVTAVFHEQTQAFSQFREKDKVFQPLKKIVSVLCKLSATASFGRDIGLVRP
jgi:hypothetical protein